MPLWTPRTSRWPTVLKGKDLIPLLLEMMLWSAEHNSETTAPDVLIAELKRDLAATVRAIRDLGGIEAFLATP